jgi:hypothetical protein
MKGTVFSSSNYGKKLFVVEKNLFSNPMRFKLDLENPSGIIIQSFKSFQLFRKIK